MFDLTVLAVATGLAAGVALIVVFGVVFLQAPLIDRILPIDKGKNQEIIEIIESDSRLYELLRHRDVTLFFIGSTSWYEKCTFGPAVRVILQTDRGYLFLFVDYANKRVANAGMQFRGEMTPINLEPLAETRKPEQHIVQIVNGTITLDPRESEFIEFAVPDCAIDVVVNGTVTVSGKFDNEIWVILLPPDEYDNWRIGGDFRTYGGTGIDTIGSVELSLPPGTPVYLVFDNTFSNSSKTVHAHIQLSYKK
jgi:hypothetical protein